MDKLAELSHGAKVVLGAAIAFLIISFFNWFEYLDVGIWSMWHGFSGILAGLLAIAIIAWQAVRLANIKLEIGVTPSMITAVLAILLFVFALIRFISTPGPTDRTIWAWIGLALAIVIVAGAWANMKAAGEGLGDMKDKMASMASSATAGSSGAGDSATDTAGDAAADATDGDDKPTA